MQGTFLAKIINYGISLTAANLPQVAVNFRAKIDPKDPTKTKDFLWWGSLKEGRAKEITIDALINMGFTDTNLDRIAGGEGLNKEIEVELVIEETATDKTDDQGNVIIREGVKFINKVGGGYMGKVLSKEEAIAKLRGIGIEVTIAERKMNAGVLTPKSSAKEGVVVDADVPF